MDVPWVQLTWDAYYNDKIPHAADPVGSFWWREILKLTPMFRWISMVNVVCGPTTLFWKDLWAQETLMLSHPRAFSYTTQEDASVKDFLHITSLHEAFHLPLSPQAHAEIQDIQTKTTQFQPSSAASDVWHYVWGKAIFKSTDYYNHYFRDIQAHPIFQWIWKSKCTMKIKVFGWLLFNDRLNTRNMLKRRHYDIGDDHSCLLCGLDVEETVDHMIFTCSFSRQCWARLNLNWEPFASRFQAIQDKKESRATKMLLEKFLLTAWSLWKERNNKDFRAVNPTLQSWLVRFITDFSLLQHRVKEACRPLVLDFVASLT